MKEKLLFQLNKFDEAEHFFGEEFIDHISFGVCSDAYLVKVYDYEPLILAKDCSFESLYLTLIDYLTAVKSQHINGPLTKNKSGYYQDWLIYKQSYNVRKAWFYMTIHDENDADEVTDLLVNALGLANFNAITQLFNTPNEDYRGHAENVMNYVGNTRAVRDLSMKYLDPKFGTQWQFHLWHLTPTTITENYGCVFYLGNELSKLDYCPYDYSAHEYYYEKLYSDIYRNLEKDIPKNKGITSERKKQIWEEICREVLNKPTDDYTDDCTDDYTDEFCNYDSENNDDIYEHIEEFYADRLLEPIDNPDEERYYNEIDETDEDCYYFLDDETDEDCVYAPDDETEEECVCAPNDETEEDCVCAPDDETEED